MLDIAIIGAGMGGLMTALRLHQKGFRPHIYESASTLRPLGVGIAIQPYGIKEMTELGLLERLRKVLVEAKESVYFNQFGQYIYGETCGTYMGYDHEQRFVHRGILQMLLYDAVIERMGKESVTLGAKFLGFEQDSKGVTMKFRPSHDGDNVPAEVRADVCIGAEGIHSAMRDQLHPEFHDPNYSGITLWRGVTKMKPYKSGGTILHIGAPSQGSLIVYPLLDNVDGTDLTLTNWVVEQNGRPRSAEDWNQKGDINEIAHMFDECDLGFMNPGEMLRTAHEVYLFPLIDHNPLPSWADGRVCLMGDAAHAMYPRGGNGSCQAFVDARVLAELLTDVADPVEAFQQFQAGRMPFVNRLVMANRGDGPEVVRRIVEERTGGKRFDDIENVLPFAEADAIFQDYHRMAGMKRPSFDQNKVDQFKSVYFQGDQGIRRDAAIPLSKA